MVPGIATLTTLPGPFEVFTCEQRTPKWPLGYVNTVVVDVLLYHVGIDKPALASELSSNPS